MTLEKAIKIQTINNDHNPDFTDAERQAAHQLSIEALKLLAQEPPEGYSCIPRPLPGETEK